MDGVNVGENMQRLDRVPDWVVGFGRLPRRQQKGGLECDPLEEEGQTPIQGYIHRGLGLYCRPCDP